MAPGETRGFLSGRVAPAPTARSEATGGERPTRPRLPKPLAQAPLAGGDVVVGGPPGYCIDPMTLDTRPSRSFALIASCRILSGGARGMSVAPVLVTVTTSPRAGQGALPAPDALAALSEATLLGGVTEENFHAAHLEGGGDLALQDGDARHWRAVFVQGRRLVGLALYAPENSRLAGGDGADVLRTIAARIAALSPGSPQSDTNPEAPDPKRRLFGRLINR